MSASDIQKCEQIIKEVEEVGEVECLTRQQYKKVSIVLREMKRQAQCAGEILRAGQLDRIQRNLSDFYQSSKMYAGKARCVSHVEYEYFATVERLKAREASYRDEFETLMRKRKAALDQLAGTTSDRLRTFDGSIPSELPGEATRLSSALLDLRDRERHMLGTRRWDEAAALHKEFERRQQEELIQRREEYWRLQEKHRTQVERLNARQIKALEDDWDRRIDHFKTCMTAELSPLREAVSRLFHKYVAAKAEYIGNDDPIVNLDETLTTAIATGQQFGATRPTKFTQRGLIPPTITGFRRPLTPKPIHMSTRQAGCAMRRAVFEPDSRRWP